MFAALQGCQCYTMLFLLEIVYLCILSFKMLDVSIADDYQDETSFLTTASTAFLFCLLSDPLRGSYSKSSP